jgi:hypothetical protein
VDDSEIARFEKGSTIIDDTIRGSLRLKWFFVDNIQPERLPVKCILALRKLKAYVSVIQNRKPSSTEALIF